MDKIAVRVDTVSKDFLLPHEKTQSIKSAVLRIFKSGGRTIETQHALRDVSFEVKEGEFFGIVGRNGSGKSTLLKMIAGIYQPTKGAIGVNGKIVPFIELGVGFNPELTGRENVFLNGALLGFTNTEMAAQYDSIVEFAELHKFMDQKLKNYSSGMQVRLAFSLAIRAEADILLIDEVLAVGDATFQRKCFDYFRDLKRRKKTVIFVSHDMNAMQQYCDRALLVNNGSVVDVNTPDSIAAEYYEIFAQATQTSKAALASHSEEERIGSFEVKYTDVSVEVDKNLQKPIRIAAKAEVTKAVANPIFGFRLRNTAGQHIMGTNTRIERIKTGSYAVGEKLSVVWEFQNLLSDGGYVLDLSIHTEDGISNYDRWLSAAVFSITKPQTTPYPVSPVIRTSLDTK